MCVILHVLPGKSVPHEKLFNMAANNWQGWGLVIRRPQKLELIRKIPKGADLSENNPLAGGNTDDLEEIEDILQDNLDCHRYLHLRHATKGSVNMNNCHPFILKNTRSEQTFFMHNGTVSGKFGQIMTADNKIWRNGSAVEVDDAPSDTRDFIEQKLKEPLEKFVHGDYSDPSFQKYIWEPMYREDGQNSRFLFISNKYPDLKVGVWSTILDEKGEPSYYASNILYCDRLERGPVFRKAEAARKASLEAEEARRRNTAVVVSTNSGEKREVTPYEHGMFQPDPKVLGGLKAVFKQFGAGNVPQEIIDLGECTTAEFKAILDNCVSQNELDTAAAFIDLIIREYVDLYLENEKLQTKKDEATKMIATLKKEMESASQS
jgi:hypothetical protein